MVKYSNPDLPHDVNADPSGRADRRDVLVLGLVFAVGLIVLAGVVCGFMLYFLSNLVFALGISGKLPIALAAWTPAAIALALALPLLLHLEDG